MSPKGGFKHLLGEVRTLGRLLWEKGWAEKNAGNLSVNVTGYFIRASRGGRFLARPVRQKYLAGECFLVTATGARFRDVAKDPERWAAVVRVAKDLKGLQILWGGKSPVWAPTSELPSHLEIHALLKRAGGRDRAVLHTHPTELIALTHLPDLPRGARFTQALWSMIPEVKMFAPGGARLVPYRMSGTEALAQKTLSALKTGSECVVWEMHGTLSVGRGPQEAFDVVDVLNKAAAVYLRVNALGKKPKGLRPRWLADIEKGFPLPPRRA